MPPFFIASRCHSCPCLPMAYSVVCDIPSDFIKTHPSILVLLYPETIKNRSINPCIFGGKLLPSFAELLHK